MGGVSRIQSLMPANRPICVYRSSGAQSETRDLPADWFQFDWCPDPTGSLQVVKSAVLSLSLGSIRPVPPWELVFVGHATSHTALSRHCKAAARARNMIYYRPANEEPDLGLVVLGRGVTQSRFFLTFVNNLTDRLNESSTSDALDVLRTHVISH